MDNRIKSVVFNEEEHSYWYQGKAYLSLQWTKYII